MARQDGLNLCSKTSFLVEPSCFVTTAYPIPRIARCQFMAVSKQRTSDEPPQRFRRRGAFIVVSLSQRMLPPGNNPSDHEALQPNGPGESKECSSLTRHGVRMGMKSPSLLSSREVGSAPPVASRTSSSLPCKDARCLPTGLTCSPLPDSRVSITWQASPGTGNHSGSSSPSPISTWLHEPGHVASGFPRAPHAVWSGLPPRHSHHEASASRFRPTNRKDRPTLRRWLSQFGIVSWNVHRQALYGPFCG